MDYKTYTKIEKIALGQEKADLVFKNTNVVDVLSGKVIKGDLAIYDNIFIGVGEYDGVKEIDGTEKYICPGFMNAHLHMESTMVLPSELLKYTVRSGTTTYIADPHEAANVKGIDGINFMLEQTENVPANVYFMVPSCVPATDIDDNGATLTAEELKIYKNNKRIKGIGEVMDAPLVVKGDKGIFDKLELFRNKILDGHAPDLPQNMLNGYVASGISTDHEAHSYDYAMKQISSGMHVHIREGSAARNLDAIVRGIVENNISVDNFSFCTDDKHIQDIISEGEISYNVRRSIELGMSPIKAIKIATINTARCYGLKNLGSISPGKQADFLVLSDFEKIEIESVYFKGKMVYDENTDIVIDKKPIKEDMLNTVHVKDIKKEDLQLKNNGEKISIIEMVDNQIITKKVDTEVPNENGIFIPNKEYSKIVNVERHKATGKLGIGIISNFGIENGAVATSVCHDSHNILIAGDNDDDIFLALNEINKIKGGYVIASKGKILSELELPVMGLMNDKGFEYVQNKLSEMLYITKSLGINENLDPFITLSFMALPVIPEIRITPRGTYDTVNMKFINE